MSMREDLHRELLPRLIKDFAFKQNSDWLQQGTCPSCGHKRELYARADSPWVLKCQRGNKCGKEHSVKDLYPDLFDNWSTRHAPTRENPNASAEAYLQSSRGLSLKGLKGCFTQEVYKDYKKDITSATVRFTLPNGAMWERLIDQPGRFDRKANFKGGYGGHCWMAPDQGFEVLARAARIWIPEGIFDALSWRQVGECAVSAMSCTNYPEHFLATLRKTCGDLGVRSPQIIFAFDAGKAGEEGMIKFVRRAKKDGWDATAALPLSEDETGDADWNDLLGQDRLKPEHIERYLWNGQVLLAETAPEKAVLLFEKSRASGAKVYNYHFTHDDQTYWASVDPAKVEELVKSDGVTEAFAAKAVLSMSRVANCAFRILYFQQDKTANESHYYLAINMPGRDQTYKAPFAPAAIVSGSKFKEVLMGAAPGALWEGSTRQLDRITSTQNQSVKMVETIDYTGYSPEHEAYILGDIAVRKGRLIEINKEDFFDLGASQVKLRARGRMLKHDYDPKRFDTSWLTPFFTAWRGRGMATLAFWGMSFFAQQIRAEHQAMGYFEMWGPANTGKSTIVKFLWRMTGRIQENYEGIDPSKSTMVGYIRTLTQVANMPVIFVESDREQEGPHVKRFDWSEIKSLFDGHINRVTGKKTQGNETNEADFRAALLIEQNEQVNSGEPILSRIMSSKWTKDGWSRETKAAAETIAKWPRDKISGTMIHILTREDAYLRTFNAAVPHYEQHLTGLGISHDRVMKVHAQLHAGLDAICKLLNAPRAMVDEAHIYIDRMAQERIDRIAGDHPVVVKFWETFDYIHDRVNHARVTDEYYAVNLIQFEQACRHNNLTVPDIDALQKHLKSSRARPFVDLKVVNSAITEKATRCWVFRTEKPSQKGAAA